MPNGIIVGDIVDAEYGRCVVTRISNGGVLVLLRDDGVAGLSTLDNVTKTGRHIDIETVLKEIF